MTIVKRLMDSFKGWFKRLFSLNNVFKLETLTHLEKIHSVHTLRLRSLWPLASVWYKTTLNTGSVGGAGVEPQSWKMRTPFPMSLAYQFWAIFNEKELREELSNKNFNFYCIWEFLPKLYFIGNCSKLEYEVPRT